MALKSNGILALFSPPLAVLGWQTIRNRKQIACRILKNRSLCQRWTYARPKNILQLQEFYHLRYTPRNCVSEESTDSSAESVAQINFYMGDVNEFEEEKEEPAKYVPPPPLNHEDAEMIGKTELVLYTMKDFLGRLLKKQEADWKNCEKVWKLFSRTVEFQDPLICFRGIKSLIWWLEAVRDAVILVDVDINEIYSVFQEKAKPQIYIIWTLALTKGQKESFINLGRQDWWREEYMKLLQHLCNQKENSKNTCQSFLGNEDLKEMGQDSNSSLDANGDLQEHFGLSGETKLEVNSLGEGVNSTCGKLDKLEESLNSIHISSGFNIKIEKTREPIAIVNTAENSIEGGGETIPKGEENYSSVKSQPVRGDMDEDWELILKEEFDRVA